MRKENNNLPVCVTMATLVNTLESLGYRMVSREMRDYHFHEVLIRMCGKLPLPDMEDIEGISRFESRNAFFCACHWSVLEVEKDFPLPS